MDFQAKKAIYLQIADFVCEQILLKKWREKEKIPSVRELAVSLEVNPNTVMRTYAFLEDQKIIEMRRGIGYFVTDSACANVLALKKDEFLTTELPQLFRSMELLQINFEMVKQFYNERLKHEKK